MLSRVFQWHMTVNLPSGVLGPTAALVLNEMFFSGKAAAADGTDMSEDTLVQFQVAMQA